MNRVRRSGDGTVSTAGRNFEGAFTNFLLDILFDYNSYMMFRFVFGYFLF